MKICIVNAHPKAAWFNGALRNRAVDDLTKVGHWRAVRDL